MRYKSSDQSDDNHQCCCNTEHPPMPQFARQSPALLDYYVISQCISQELAATRACSCPECRYRQNKLIELQDILDRFYGLKK